MDQLLTILIENKFNPSSLTFQKNLFKYYAGHNYDNKCLEDLETKLKIKYNILRSYLSSYINSYLGMSKEDFIEYKKEQVEKNKDLYVGVKNPILFMHGKETLFLWTDNEEKELFLSEIYNYSSKNNFSVEFNTKMAEKIGISVKRYKELLNLYKKNYLDNKDIQKKSKQDIIDKRRMGNESLRKVFEGIMSASSTEEVDKIITESNYPPVTIKNNFRFYEKFYTKEQNEDFKIMINAYKYYRKNKAHEIKEQRRIEKANDELKIKLEEARRIVSVYLNTFGMTHVGFLSKMNITSDQFNDYIESIKKNDKDFYEKYLKLKDKKEKDEKESLEKQINEVGFRLAEGYKEDNNRNFDIIDYFYTTDIPLSNIDYLAKSLVKGYRQTLIKKFSRSYKDADKYSSSEHKNIFQDTVRIGVEKDKNGKIIENSGRLVTDEEKNYLINYLNENNIPINRFTYKAAFRRYINGFITFEDNDINVKKRQLINKDNS